MNLSTMHNFAFICVPKTGSTSVGNILAEHSSINYDWKPSLKHMGAQVFHDHVMLFHKSLFPETAIESFCIMREPVDWVTSWYKYRSRKELLSFTNNPRLKHRPTLYCGDLTIESFIEEVVKEGQKAPFAKILTQSRYIRLDNGEVGMDKVFRYENGMEPVEEYISNKMGREIQIPKLNVSPHRNTDISLELIERLKDKFKADCELYDQTPI